MHSGLLPRSLLVWLRFGACVATDCARQAKKYTPGCPMALRFAFFRPTWLVRTLPGRPRDAPGLNFRGPNDSFFDVCRFGCARFPTTSRPLRNTAWAHEFQASGLLRSSRHRAKTRFERCSGKGSRWQRVRQGPGSIPREPTQRLRLPTWRPEQPTRRPRRPTWRPRRPNLALRGRSKRVPVRPRAIPERPSRPRSKFHRFFVDFSSIFDRVFDEFHSLRTAFGLCLALLPCSADSVRPTKRTKKKRAAIAFVLRLAAQACLYDFHDQTHNFRANVLHGAPRQVHLVTRYLDTWLWLLLWLWL